MKIDWSKGLVSGAVYNGAPELTKILAEVNNSAFRFRFLLEPWKYVQANES